MKNVFFVAVVMTGFWWLLHEELCNMHNLEIEYIILLYVTLTSVSSHSAMSVSNGPINGDPFIVWVFTIWSSNKIWSKSNNCLQRTTDFTHTQIHVCMFYTVSTVNRTVEVYNTNLYVIGSGQNANACLSIGNKSELDIFPFCLHLFQSLRCISVCRCSKLI